MISQSHVVEGSCNLMSEPLIACCHPVKFGGLGPCGSDMFFTFHGDLARPRDSRVLRLYGKGFLMLSYPLDKSGDRSHCGSSDVFSLSRDLTRPRD